MSYSPAGYVAHRLDGKYHRERRGEAFDRVERLNVSERRHAMHRVVLQRIGVGLAPSPRRHREGSRHLTPSAVSKLANRIVRITRRLAHVSNAPFLHACVAAGDVRRFNHAAKVANAPVRNPAPKLPGQDRRFLFRYPLRPQPDQSGEPRKELRTKLLDHVAGSLCR